MQNYCFFLTCTNTFPTENKRFLQKLLNRVCKIQKIVVSLQQIYKIQKIVVSLQQI